MLEFAIVLAFVLIPLLMGLVEFGWIFNGWITVTAAAREGARVAVLEDDNDEDVSAAVTKHLSNSILTGHHTEPPDRTEENIEVTVRGKLQPIVGIFVSGEREIVGQASMRREYSVDDNN